MVETVLVGVQTVVGVAAVLLGLALFGLAAIGMIRFPDAYSRLTAVTKSGTLGICALLLGVMVLRPAVETVVLLGLAIALQLLTAPIGGFALSRGTLRSGVKIPRVRYDERS